MNNLNSHLITKTHGKAHDDNVIIYNDVRVSVLLDGVIRIEKGAFCDDATQSFWFRNHGKTDFKAEKTGNKLTVTTDRAEFCINLSNGKPVYAKCGDLISKCDNKKNLKGTARTLDQARGKVRLYDGVCSLDGAAVIDDSKSLIVSDNGEIVSRSGKAKDIYVFCYGHKYTEAVKALYKLTGETPLIPKYVLGNWWSRYHTYTEQSYIDLMLEFKRKNIPLTVATIDMDWHWIDADINKRFPDFKAKKDDYFIVMKGWTGYSWNTDLFPDYKRFLKNLHSMGLKTTVNLHPASGIRSFEDMYPEMAKAMNVDPKTGEKVDFDITDSGFINNYFDIVHHPYEDNGVDFWWIDWQQGKNTKTPGLDPLWALNHYHYLDNERNGKRPMILSRYAGIGSHRYPLGFSGDSYMLWSALDFQPYFTATASNCGYTWWSHDIGGHCNGKHDYEMYTRWVQLGVFSPILRLHSSKNEWCGKEPWNYGGGADKIISDFLRLRHSLIPYIYTMNRRTNEQGRALCEPLYYFEPEKDEAYECKNGFMFGSELLVCPVTEKADKRTHTAQTSVYLPEGRWTNIFNKKIYKGGKKVRVSSEFHEMPVFAKEGAIITVSCDEGNSIRCPEKLKLCIYRGNNEFVLYEDDGETFDYKNGKYSETVISVSEDKSNFRVKISGAKNQEFMPEKRTYILEFGDIISSKKTDAYIDGDKAEITEAQNDGLVITVENVAIESTVEIELKNTEVRKNPPYVKEVVRALSRYDAANIKKSLMFLPLKNLNDRKKLASSVRFLSDKALKDQLLEILEDLQ